MSSHPAWARNPPALGGSRARTRGAGCHLQKGGDSEMSRQRGLGPVPAILVEPSIYLPCRRVLGRCCWGSWQMGRGWYPCRSHHLSWVGTPVER